MSLPINNYCERLTDAFWAEPINALSNGAFLISATAVYLLLKKHKLSGYYTILPYQLAIVAIGSFLWHTARNPITHILDGSLLYIFIGTVFLFLLKLLTNKWSWAWAGLIGLVSFQVAVFIFVPILKDTPIRHIITLLIFGLLSIWVSQKVRKVPLSMIIALCLYVGAILAKGMDLGVCDIFPIGTHFLWHTLGAAAGYYSVISLVNLKETLTKNDS
jgi:hypothetical protein